MDTPALATAAYWAALLENIADFAFVVVIVALAVELVAGRVSRHFQGQLDRARELQIVSLRNETAQLNHENLKLQALLAPRSLKVDQQADLSQAMEPFAGKKILVGSPTMEGEPLYLSGQIIEALKIAHIDVVDLRGAQGPLGGFSFGIHIAGPDATLTKALEMLFRKYGQQVDNNPKSDAAALLTIPAHQQVKGAAAAIFVGVKPLPDAAAQKELPRMKTIIVQ